jgi:hypothetical protein
VDTNVSEKYSVFIFSVEVSIMRMRSGDIGDYPDPREGHGRSIYTGSDLFRRP